MINDASLNWNTSFRDIQDAANIPAIETEHKFIDLQINQVSIFRSSYVPIYVSPEINLAQLTPQPSVSAFTRQSMPGWAVFLAEGFGGNG